MKAKIDHEAAVDAMKKPKQQELIKMPPVGGPSLTKKKHVHKKVHAKAKQPKPVKVQAPKPKKAKARKDEIPKDEAAKFAQWVQTRIKHDARKELKKQPAKVAKATKKKLKVAMQAAKKITKKKKLAAKAAPSGVPSLKSLKEEAQHAAKESATLTARQVLEFEVAA